MKRILYFLFICSSVIITRAQEKKALNITKAEFAPKIDGILDDQAWENVEEATGFIQYNPEMGLNAEAHQNTVVKMTYTDKAIFVSAYLYDDPSNVMKAFSNRDNFGQADYFGVTFNPNNDAQNDIKFYVLSSGTQIDILGAPGGRRRGSGPGGDRGWNAVWDSAVKHVDNGWIVEMKIPYAALRFSNRKDAIWGIQFNRKIKKDNLDYSWNPIDRAQGSQSLYHGELKGLNNITPPTRLSFYPFSSATAVSKSGTTEDAYSIGLDVKYGITESFTLDATLIPDFSQAAFDKVELNLSPFEQRFDEQRQFFKEGVNLFSKGRLFYSRRIGNRPINYSDAYNDLVSEVDEVEEVVDNPDKSTMLNAVKVSGRTKSGLGIGFFNAITDKTVARIKNTKYLFDINDVITDSIVSYRNKTTESFANYNILVVDQQFNKNSSISLINTNVSRAGEFRDANVTGLLFNLSDKESLFNVNGALKMSSINHVDENSTGYNGSLSVGKISGTYQYGLNYDFADENYNINDLGYFTRNNYKRLTSKLSYQIFKPVGFLNSLSVRFESVLNWRANTNDYAGQFLELNVFARTKKQMFIGFNIETAPGKQSDYYEARDQLNNRYYVFKNWVNTRAWIYTNSNKVLSTSVNFGYGKLFEKGREMKNFNFRLGPSIRFNDNFTLRYRINYENSKGQRGYVTRIDDEIIFGQRDQKTIENSITGNFNFNSFHGLSLSFRNYWSTATYNEDLYTLEEKGSLSNQAGHTLTNLDIDPNRNFNIWNLDFSYTWQFAPGSQLIALYRNQLFNSTNASLDNYLDSLSDLFKQDIAHTFSLKMIYYIDYNTIKNAFQKKSTLDSMP